MEENNEKQPNNPSAFPTMGYEYVNNSDQAPTYGNFGRLTTRDYFAAKAMQSFLIGIESDASYEFNIVAENSYNIADAMLKERMKYEQ